MVMVIGVKDNHITDIAHSSILFHDHEVSLCMHGALIMLTILPYEKKVSLIALVHYNILFG
jgi:hypothetical protein